MITEGLCQCGCGQKTTIHERNRPCEGVVKGTPRGFLLGHGMKGKRGANWNGGRQVDALGYVRVADWRKCHYCKQYDDPDHLSLSGSSAYHQICANSYSRERYARVRG